jgi:hypothetical protein
VGIFVLDDGKVSALGCSDLGFLSTGSFFKDYIRVRTVLPTSDL